MDMYSLLREFADSWFLLLMTTFFLGTIVWVFRPRASATYKDTAAIPFRHEDKPASQHDIAVRVASGDAQTPKPEDRI